MHISGALAMVCAGIIVGYIVRSNPDTDIKALDNFWEAIDEILNAILFTLLGMEVLLLEIYPYFNFMLLSIITVLLSRYLSVNAVIVSINHFSKQKFNKMVKNSLIWGGLRGGLAVGLALSLPDSQSKNIILTATYATVVFSIIIQGGTFNKLTRYWEKTK